jgi:hypothetical protein
LRAKTLENLDTQKKLELKDTSYFRNVPPKRFKDKCEMVEANEDPLEPNII